MREAVQQRQLAQQALPDAQPGAEARLQDLQQGLQAAGPPVRRAGGRRVPRAPFPFPFPRVPWAGAALPWTVALPSPQIHPVREPLLRLAGGTAGLLAEALGCLGDQMCLPEECGWGSAGAGRVLRLFLNLYRLCLLCFSKLLIFFLILDFQKKALRCRNNIAFVLNVLGLIAFLPGREEAQAVFKPEDLQGSWAWRF